ncbi:ABC transporter ATP-binding protein [Phyllobacterium sp. YR531]|uniref:ABC transporter ATP-binding protein n=1 Tax=Phyllobacterium sp. YR531 TaxID=1144343 RepID=UPI00026F6475|nr:ABC transporter ATP-binding protein [Phyllobacterium sp. YR531]EJM98773.1 ABC-type bacteriocin/lantibiotic exporter [Phyllobacterium sp. YR531]
MLRQLFGKFEGLIDFRSHELHLDNSSSALRILIVLLAPFRWIIGLSAISGMAITLIELARVYAISYLVDTVSVSPQKIISPDNLFLFGIIIAAYAILDPLVWLTNYMLRAQSLSSQSEASALWQAHKAASKHDLAYFNSLHAGQITARIGHVADAAQSCAELVAGRFPMGFIRFLGSISIMLYLSPVFLFPVAIWLVLNAFFAVYLAPKVNVQVEKISQGASGIYGVITEYFSNIRSIKSSYVYDTENNFILQKIDQQNNNNIEINRLTTITGLYIRLINTGLLSAVILLGIYGLNYGTVSVGEFVAAVTLAGGMAADAGWFVAIWEGITQSLGAIRDARSTIISNPQITDYGTNSFRGFNEPPQISLKNVSFGYEAGKQILNDISLEILPGERIGIVGLSGSGKSTLVELLLRLYDVTTGTILLNGQNIKHIPLSTLRGVFAFVSQKESLFHRSIRDNIAFGTGNASINEIHWAAERAGAASFIESLGGGDGPSGYDIVIGERGTKLSGGQQQRIMLARALLQKRHILVLDEATSALDSKTESFIQASINENAENKTVIAIAHRISTVKNFDRIVLLDKGFIAAVGVHEDLLNSNDLYRELWDKQRR